MRGLTAGGAPRVGAVPVVGELHRAPPLHVDRLRHGVRRVAIEVEVLVEQVADGERGASAVVGRRERSDEVEHRDEHRPQPGQHAPDQVVTTGPERVQLQRLDQSGPPLDRCLIGCRGTDGDEQPVEVPPGARVVVARGGVDAPVLEHAEHATHEARPSGASERPLALVVALERTELGEPGVVQDGSAQRAVVDRHRGDPHDRDVDHRAAPRPHLVLVVRHLDRQRLAGHAVGEQPEDALHVRERHGRISHGSSTSTISATARCTSTSSLTARAIATSQARRGSMPPPTSWAA